MPDQIDTTRRVTGFMPVIDLGGFDCDRFRAALDAAADNLADMARRIAASTRLWWVAHHRLRGEHALADVIRDQPGRQAVRDGMGDVLHWLRECACYDPTPGRCDHLHDHVVPRAAASIAAAIGADPDDVLAAMRRHPAYRRHPTTEDT